VTGWVTVALVAAEKAGIDVRPQTLQGCRDWFRTITDADGTVGYAGKGSGYPALLGTAWFAETLLRTERGLPRRDATLRKLLGTLPRWPDDARGGGLEYGAADPMHWYYGTLAAFHAGEPSWDLWHPRIRAVLLPRQERTGCARGSWPPAGATGRHGGRLVTTALCALTLEVYYRYPRAAMR
jgi:hypothetical protein